MQATQLPLGIGLREGNSLDNFVTGPNAEAIEAVGSVSRAEGPRLIYLCGVPGTGKSHLLEAACRRVAEADRRGAYVGMRDANALDPAMLQGMEHFDLVCLDDVDAIAGKIDWEEAVFHLYNRSEAAGGRLCMAGSGVPGEAAYMLRDLASRLCASAVFKLRPLSETDRGTALRRRARQRGFELSDEVGRYLLRHYPRDMHSLFRVLDRLDRSSMAAQRRITVPFLKALLET